jgi:antitoxin component of RelBE/YafQ-DinJ toxin-antitoxin module
MAKHVSYRLSDKDKHIIQMLSEHFGVSDTDAIRIATRKIAKEEGLNVDFNPSQEDGIRKPGISQK